MIADSLKYKTKWTIAKYADDQAVAEDRPYEIKEIDGNLLLNLGIGLALDLLIGAGGTTYANANARLGVGDSSTAEAAGQTALQAATNKLSISTTSVSRSGQTLTAVASFTGGQANFAWNEFVFDNGATALNRKVSAQGTKTSGQTWTLTLTITVS